MADLQNGEKASTRIASREVTCSAVPVQIEGRLTDGRFFYFRARHSGVTLGFGDSPNSAVGPGPVVRFDGIGEHAVGWMGVDLAESLLEFLVRAVAREEEIAEGCMKSDPPCYSEPVERVACCGRSARHCATGMDIVGAPCCPRCNHLVPPGKPTPEAAS